MLQSMGRKGLDMIGHTHIFIAALSTIARRRKQSKCPSMDEWINKMRYKHVMKYYVTLRKGILIHAMTWRKLEGISVHGILQAKILEWIAMPFSRGSS